METNLTRSLVINDICNATFIYIPGETPEAEVGEDVQEGED